MTVFLAQWETGLAIRFRSLRWEEFRRFEARLQYESPMAVYNDVYRLCVLEGPAIEDLLAGPVEFVARALIANNPFNGTFEDLSRALEVKRSEIASDYLKCARAQVAALFRYNFEEIDKWDAETFFERLAQSEFVLKRPLNASDPNKKKKRQQKKQQLTDRQQQAIDATRERDRQLMPKAAEEELAEDDTPKPEKRSATNAQQMVIDRVNQARRR